jgi:hypothetical protein
MLQTISSQYVIDIFGAVLRVVRCGFHTASGLGNWNADRESGHAPMGLLWSVRTQKMKQRIRFRQDRSSYHVPYVLIIDR